MIEPCFALLQSGQEVLDVAVKTLREGSSTKERVKMLQEAALMAQFRHENIVRLHGVVTETEEVNVLFKVEAVDPNTSC